jgi:hypothetical protein
MPLLAGSMTIRMSLRNFPSICLPAYHRISAYTPCSTGYRPA